MVRWWCSLSVNILKGYSHSPASFVRQISGLLNESTGWTLVDTISGSLTQQDLVFGSSISGTTVSGISIEKEFCIRLSGFDNHVHLYGYDVCTTISGVTTYSGEIYGPSESKVFCPPGEFKFWAFADRYHLKFVFEEPSSYLHYHGYVGFIESFYDIGFDPLPILVFATASGESSIEDGVSPVMRNSVGVVGSYNAWVPYSFSFGVAGRVPSCGGMSVVLYNTGDYSEVRGIPRGLLKIPPSFAGNGSEYVLASGIYYSFYGSGDLTNSYMYGPVVHYGYEGGAPSCI